MNLPDRGEPNFNPVSVEGTAASSGITDYRANSGDIGKDRSLERLVEWAETKGVSVPEYVAIKPVPPDVQLLLSGRPVDAKYFECQPRLGHELIYWSDNPHNRFLSIVDPGEKAVVIHVKEEVLEVDERFLHVLAHEVFEIEALKEEFDNADGRLSVHAVHALIQPSLSMKNLHWRAWDAADDLIYRLRGEK